jgi:purine-binding chemotaxis protein CheW
MTKKRRISYSDLARGQEAPAVAPEVAESPAPVSPEVAQPSAPVESAVPVEAPAPPAPAELAVAGDAVPDRQHLIVRVGREWFALPLDAVDEALDFGELHRLPEMGETMLGVFSLRGALVPLFTPVGPLGVPLTTGSAAIVFSVSGGRVAIAVDDVDDVLMIHPADVRRAPIDTEDGVLLGVVRRGRDLVGVLDPRALVSACRAEPVLEAV